PTLRTQAQANRRRFRALSRVCRKSSMVAGSSQVRQSASVKACSFGFAGWILYSIRVRTPRDKTQGTGGTNRTDGTSILDPGTTGRAGQEMGTNQFALPSSSPRPTRVRWLIFVLLCAASWLLYLHRYTWGVIKPALRAENPGLTDTEVGWLD